MSPAPPSFGALAQALQALAGSSLLPYVAAALGTLALRRDPVRARLLLADGALLALGIMLPATILRSLALWDFQQILLFTVVLGIRLALKRALP